MTEPEGDSQAISVAELLARNGQRVGAGGGGRRRRGVKGGISVAELTGEFPAVRNARAGAESSESAEPVEEVATPETSAVAQAEAPEAPVMPKATEPVKPVRAVKVDAPDATAVFTLADADAQDEADAGAAAKAALVKPALVKPALVKPAPVKPAPAKSAPADDAPTVVAPALRDADPTGRGTNSGWRSVASTAVTEPGPQPEPRLLSGQTLAGDLMRQDSDRTETGHDEDPAADPENLDDPENLTDLDALDDEPEASGAKQWAVLLGQGAVALVAGALMFKGFEKLWDMLPMVALVLAVLVIVGLVAMVRILRRTDDITSLVIAVVAGVFVTLGPLAFLLGTS